MLSLFKNLFGFGKKKKDELKITVMLIGLDNAGKSTFLASLKGHADFKPMPTVGFNREVLKHEHYEITYFDVGGGANIRAIWPNYFPSIHGAIFVIDSADEKRLEESRQTLVDSIKHPYFKGKPLLLLANKQDLPNSLEPSEISERLQLHELTEYVSSFNILPCIAKRELTKNKTDEHIVKGLDWLSSQIEKDLETLCSRIEKEEKEFEDEEKRLADEKWERVRKMREERARQQEEEERKKKEQEEDEKSSKKSNKD
ncbi:hypothetical protein NAEGRDRAFT_68064 [Naegleria gruberi]|uniref:ARF/SAR family small GTPase n=1 Tax=Naegleria gruberi TaxID=5762 RepID=D2VGQ9_NAEGR|nr:uncharacterized protein NAEGRDRAFT_68064 [Naegleria gruberi]EFC44105.1 hypothetical protein NAEGRDRAFT_68064 [Naegleria gruberi]|eukprot:XP_002676849.1 hypothetical protein NAEGRDRAFT_68064 [Naegleria gruberi strain NEG-M]